MRTVEEKLARSLTAESIELIPYLPYLLQDIWELGSSPKDILELIVKHIHVSVHTMVLDLACGKGAVSVHIAKNLGCKVKGIDLIPEFIDVALDTAQEFGVGTLCEFIVGDITKAINSEKDYDIVIFGSVGDVLGNTEETITLLKNTVKKGGYIIIDDAYGTNNSNTTYLTRERWLTIFHKTKVKLVGEKTMSDDEMIRVNHEQQPLIMQRANELKVQFPLKEHLFDSYSQSQQAECDELENEISGVTLLLQVID